MESISTNLLLNLLEGGCESIQLCGENLAIWYHLFWCMVYTIQSCGRIQYWYTIVCGTQEYGGIQCWYMYNCLWKRSIVGLYQPCLHQRSHSLPGLASVSQQHPARSSSRAGYHFFWVSHVLFFCDTLEFYMCCSSVIPKSFTCAVLLWYLRVLHVLFFCDT